MKNRIFLVMLSLQLAALSFLPFIEKAIAATSDVEGFIIQADRVVGENMKAMVVAGETSGSKAKPMLRITYDSAKIYGMRLTKQFRTPGGTVSITMKASGPVQIKGMQVDASAISFKGACVHAAKVIPNAALEGVTMVAHTMNAANSSLEQLKLETVNGNGGVQKPGTLKILQELGSMPFEQMNKEIKKITSGQLPLTCEGVSEEDELPEKVEDAVGTVADPVDDLLDEVEDPLDGTIGKVTDPLDDTIGKVTDPVKDTIGKVTGSLKDTIGKVTDPLEDTVGKVTDPLKDTIGKVTEPVEDTVDKVTTPVEEAVGKVTEPVKEVVKETTVTAKKVTEPVAEPAKKTVDETAKAACEKLGALNGEMTKELALELIDKALAENKMLNELCPTDATLTKQLEKWTEDLLDSLGLLSLLGLKPSEEEQLKKMREAILKEPDGSILKF